MNQTIRPLPENWLLDMEKQRDWVKGHFTENANEKYAPIVGKLRLLDTIISEKWIEPSETWKLQSLGVTFGDALSERFGLKWVLVEDELGQSGALQYAATDFLIFPVTAISKRIERGDDVDLRELFSGFCELIENGIKREEAKQSRRRD